VSLAALDLKRFSRGGSGGFWLDPEILGFSVFHLNSRVSHFLLTSPSCKLCRIHVLVYASEFMAVTIPDIGSTY